MATKGTGIVNTKSAAGGNTFARVIKKVDEIVNNSVTLQNDDELLVALNANKIYGYYLLLLINTSTVADYKHGVSLPSGATGTRINGFLTGANPISFSDLSPNNTTAVSGNQCLVLTGRVIVGGTGGNFQFQFAQTNLEVADTKTLKGSLLVIWEETA